MPRTQRVVSVSENMCSFLCDQKLFEELLKLGEVGLWGGVFSLCFMFLLKEKHSCGFAIAWRPPVLKTQFPS